MQAPMTTPTLDRKGLFQALGAYLCWGVLPLYFLLLQDVGADQVVAHRVLWSLLFLAAIVLLGRRGAKLRAALGDWRLIGLLAISALLIGVNWLIYIWAVQTNHVLQASLGYFLNPLVNVLFGTALLGERLNRMQVAAVALAAGGVAVLASGAGGGLWISLTLAVSFSLYGLLRKVAAVESIEGLAIETALLTPLAVLWLVWLGDANQFGAVAGTSALLALAGIVTATPLLLFAAAARRLPYSTLGLIQYLSPTMQFVLAITVFGEVMTTAHILCFAMIWAGLAVYVLSMKRPPPPVRVE